MVTKPKSASISFPRISISDAGGLGLARRATGGRRGLAQRQAAGIAPLRDGGEFILKMLGGIRRDFHATCFQVLRSYLEPHELPYFDARVIPAKTAALVAIHGLQGQQSRSTKGLVCWAPPGLGYCKKLLSALA